MSYQVLYRRFRPRTFSDVVGQEHITEILKNQIKNNRVAHAYLFTGSRGTGKTSTAKVFANAINCLDPVNGEPCGKCSYCVDPAVDVVEIDAASNRGIDEIRSLRDKVNYMPAVGKYRVYIIDEVHMLTTEAFNALLKTLEEPPEHIVFIFATTEANKLLPTILSRCQRFDFARIRINTLVDRLKAILTQINVGYEEEALTVIAENSDGALRDALSFLDKAISFGSGDFVKEEDVISALGLTGSRDIIKIAEAILREDVNEAFISLNNAIRNGADVLNIISSLIEYFRDGMICLNTSNPSEMIQKGQSYISSVRESTKILDNETLVLFISYLSRLRNDAKYVSDSRSLLECEIIRLSDREKLISDYSLTTKIEQLEKRLAGLSEKVKELSMGEVKVIREVVTTAEPQKQEEPEPEMPQKRTQGMMNAPKEYMYDKAQIRIFQDAVTFAANYVLNRDRMLTLSSIFQNLKVYGYTEDTIYVYPAGPAVSIMSSYDQRGGKDILERAIFDKLGERYNVIVTAKPLKKPDREYEPKKPDVMTSAVPNRPKLRGGRPTPQVDIKKQAEAIQENELDELMAQAYSEENLIQEIPEDAVTQNNIASVSDIPEITAEEKEINDDIPDIITSENSMSLDIEDDFQDLINDTFGELTEL